VFVKHEEAQPVGAFKVRGGLTLLAAMSEGARARGTVSYSTGNHARSLAYASRTYGAPCTVVMPAAASPAKAAAVAALGAEVILHGPDLEAAQHHAEALAERTGARLVSPGDTPELLAGVGTLYLEIFEAEPDLDAVLVPVGVDDRHHRGRRGRGRAGGPAEPSGAVRGQAGGHRLHRRQRQRGGAGGSGPAVTGADSESPAGQPGSLGSGGGGTLCAYRKRF
jgi:hypothetical protein